MQVSFTCKKCHGTYQLEIGNMTQEEVEEKLHAGIGFECPGHHVELGARSDYWVIDWDSKVDVEPQTDEQWFEEMKEKVGDLWDTTQLQEEFTVEGFSYGLCVTKRKDTKEEVILSFSNSPSGKRYYHK